MALKEGPLFSLPFAPRFGSILPPSSVLLTGYGDHEDSLDQIRHQTVPVLPGAAADNMFRLHELAQEYVDRWGTMEPVREIRVIGHSDRVIRNGRHQTSDEMAVSQRRASDAWREFGRMILTTPTTKFTAQQFKDEIDSGNLNIIVTGIGAAHTIDRPIRVPAPENRRVEIQLSSTQSLSI